MFVIKFIFKSKFSSLTIWKGECPKNYGIFGDFLPNGGLFEKIPKNPVILVSPIKLNMTMLMQNLVNADVKPPHWP